MSASKEAKKGFTLLEILLVVAAIAILASIVIVALNPGKQLGQTRNSQRRVDVTTILNAAYQYSLDAEILPAAITSTAACGSVATQEICTTGGTCTGLVDLSVLTANEKYVVSLPRDPKDASTNGTGYFITKTANDRLTVCAPGAEQGETISVTR